MQEDVQMGVTRRACATIIFEKQQKQNFKKNWKNKKPINGLGTKTHLLLN